MNIPILSHNRLQILGITQPVAGGSPVGAIASGSHPSGYLMMKQGKGGSKQPREGEEKVDISELAKLLSKGMEAKGGWR